MITSEYIDSLGLEKEKADILKNELKKDSFYREILYKIGVSPAYIEKIMRTVDPAEIDPEQADIMTEKARIEWADFIPANKKN